MRMLFYFALITLPLVTNQEKDSNLKERLGAKLEVETSVIKATTCITEGYSVRSDLTLNAVYKNVGRYPIILDKGSGTIGGEKIYHSLQNGKPDLIEHDVRRTIWVISEPPRKEGAIPSDSFVILQPQEQYQGKAIIILIIDDRKRYEHFSADTHY